MTDPNFRIDGSLLYGADEEVGEIVRRRISQMEGQRFGYRNPATGQLPYRAIGVIRNDVIVGGVVFHNYRLHKGIPIDIEMSAAFEPSNWAMPSTLRKLFAYPFLGIGVRRMTTITWANNKEARRIDEGLGFVQEGVIRCAADGEQDAIVYGMKREECRFIPKEARVWPYGQAYTTHTT